VAEGPMAALDDRLALAGADDHRRSQDMGDVAGVSEGEGPRLSARIVDDATSGPPCPRAGPREGHACLADLAQGTVCKIRDQEEVKPHKVRYYLECRDPEFAEKMAEVLCVYRKVKVLKKAAALSKTKPSDKVAIIFWREVASPAPGPKLPTSEEPYRPSARCLAASRSDCLCLISCWRSSWSRLNRWCREFLMSSQSAFRMLLHGKL
jgi:hypothetical protein